MNNVVSRWDKKSGSLYPNWLIEGFNKVLMDTSLIDMELVGHQFTWERGRGTKQWMEVRMDRALTIVSWLQMFPFAKLYNLKGSPSDHSPIPMLPNIVNKNVKRRIFHFKNEWLTEPMCRSLVAGKWENGDTDIQSKVKRYSEKLDEWGIEVTSKFSSRIL
ncbi:uncharacterized protein LOC141680306 [Apium graveolens]|uniref:uncharacterized protein LOC141680306 n=1 Tax=Apium graveolens TaxID=4045 RepID=UPI003D78CBC2